MATILKKPLIEKAVKGGRPRTYDWDELLDGKPRRLTKGVDFWCKPISLRTYALRAAAVRGVGCIANIDGNTVDIQAVDKGKGKRRARSS